MQVKFLLKNLIFCSLFTVFCSLTFAHDPGLSNVDLRLESNRIVAQLAYNYVDIEGAVLVDKNLDRVITPEEFEAAKSSLEQLAKSSLEITFDSKKIEPSEVSVKISKAEDGRDTAFFTLMYPGIPSNELTVKSAIMEKLSRGHREYFKLTNAEGKTISEALFDATNYSAQVSAGELSAALGKWHTFKQFIELGIEHILLGFDHLCFLLALLLAANNLSSVVKIITSFTVAHSITLALAALNIVTISPGFVEPMIAVSIIYVGLENVWRRGQEIEGRWLLTFAFGLIHGFGFASVLRELNIGAGGSGLAIPLVSFNVGVEIGQLCIAAIFWGMIWKVRKTEQFKKFLVPVGSILVAIAGGYWLIERTLLSK
jgi:hydrogenase/urease accessory protein HupE